MLWAVASIRRSLDFNKIFNTKSAEIELTQARVEQFDPDFDDISLSALRGIHRYLFQDLYDWAGELREVDISKGVTRFATMTRSRLWLSWTAH